MAARTGAPDGVVEDEHALRPNDLLQQPLDLRIIPLLDHLVIREVLLDARPMHPLEPVLVERELGLAPAHVVHDRGVRLAADVRLRLALDGVGVRVRGLVVERLVVVEGRRDVAGRENCGGRHRVGCGT